MTILNEAKHEASKGNGRYVVMATQGQGGCVDEQYDTLNEALDHVERHKGGASFGIVYPNGEWHKWKD